MIQDSPFKLHDILQIENMKIENIVTFKRLSHGSIQAPMHYFYISKDSPLKGFPTIYNVIFYSKEHTCHESTDP